MGRDIEHGDMADEDVDGVQSVRLVQMLGFCQGKDDLVHNKELAADFFPEMVTSIWLHWTSISLLPSYILWT